MIVYLFFFFKQKTAYEMRISDWSSDVCSSDLLGEKRTANADFFGARMIAEDDIPGGPPEERSLVETVLARARAVFADEGMDALLADCREQEVAVLQQAEAACHAPLRKDEKAAAKALTDDAGRRLDTLDRKSNRLNSSH